MKGRIFSQVLYTALLLGGVLLCATELRAQHYVGVRGGWGMGSSRFFPQQEMGYETRLINGGLSYKFYGEQLAVGAVQVDLQFAQKGYKYLVDPAEEGEPENDLTYHRRINAVELPIMWQPHFYFFERKARFFLNLGTHFSYNISSSEETESKMEGTSEGGAYTMETVRDNRFGFGLCGGAGLTFLIGRCDVSLEARYNYGFSDILRTHTEYEENPVRSPLDQFNLSLGVYYRLGKDGLRAAPSKRMREKLVEAEAERLINERATESKKEPQQTEPTQELEQTQQTELTQELEQTESTPQAAPSQALDH